MPSLIAEALYADAAGEDRRIYPKLGIHSRAELGPWMAAHSRIEEPTT